MAHVGVLREEGRMGFVHPAIEQGTVFIEVFAENIADAEATLNTLPLAPWIKCNIFPTLTPDEAKALQESAMTGQ